MDHMRRVRDKAVQSEIDALMDLDDRLQRGDPDINFYWPGEPRPAPSHIPWWRRLLKL